MKCCHIEDWKPVNDEEAKRRLIFYRRLRGAGPHKANRLADIIWPEHKMESQGAGAAATRVLKRLGCYYEGDRNNWGWILSFK